MRDDQRLEALFVRALRARLGMSRRELGAAISFSRFTIEHWEQGTKKPSYEALVQLATLLMAAQPLAHPASRPLPLTPTAPTSRTIVPQAPAMRHTISA